MLSQPGKPMADELDDTDRAIVAALARNARSTFAEIGAEVGLSAPATKRRVDRLEQMGVIVEYTVILDHAQLGFPLEAFVELRFSGNARVHSIASIGADIPEVTALFTVAGDPDAIAHIRVEDVRHLTRVVDRLRSKQQVVGTKTLMVLSTFRQDGQN